ncbi:metallophosphoesterase [Fluviicola taffensis]|uniref:Metallophosphoesterase n=1 Tax=Fluviicola taffensis (strain DSM 16823 / NCIMB 13979 / RW262) TaxID=755732 RepID=F2ICK2_FLUTR|nr:metallophosphoesterase [Fluviicola taffensis]AEA45472.1 metallophosphoesterase [Fluviicola taffensis DSM 16823]
MFGLVFLLLLVSQATFSYSLFETQNPILLILGILQLILFFGAVIITMKSFRQSRTADYRKGFNAFGVMIATGVPTLGFFLFGLIYIITGFVFIEYLGFGIALSLFFAILVGIIWGRWNWKTHTIEIPFENLPADLDGLRIVQISDIHVGSFFNKYDKVEKAIQQINQLEADFVFFTGDLVNNIAEEMLGWEPVFSKIQAKEGKYSILGNHDYGDYVPWEKEETKNANLAKLIAIHKEIGFTPLLNESIELKPGFWLLGVENWGKPPFRQSGELEKTLGKVPLNSFKLLLSHDPSHFDEEVIKTGVDLTLSGHTHGMQFGIERFGIKWSPVSLRYKKWAGLYQTGKQFLYVNRGFGYLGFPGRVGIYPEITEIVLRRK